LPGGAGIDHDGFVVYRMDLRHPAHVDDDSLIHLCLAIARMTASSDGDGNFGSRGELQSDTDILGIRRDKYANRHFTDDPAEVSGRRSAVILICFQNAA